MNVQTSGSGLRLVRQAEMAECGLACLCSLASHYGYDTDLSTLRSKYGCSSRGTSVRELIRIAHDLGFTSKVLRIELEQLNTLQCPAILHWSFNHFVIIERVTRNGVVILDPSRGRRKVEGRELNECFTGIALEIRPSLDFARGKRKIPALRLRDLWPPHVPVTLSLGLIVLLSAGLQVASISVPFVLSAALEHMQISLLENSTPIFIALFAATSLVVCASRYVRSLVILSVGPRLAGAVMQSIARHILSINIQWFNKRGVGDIIDRVSSSTYVHKFLISEGLVCLFDVFAIFSCLFVGVFIDARLTSVVAVSLVAKLSLYYVAAPTLESHLSEQVVRQANQNTILIDIVRTIKTVKVNNSELGRLQTWMRSYDQLIRSERRLGHFQAGIEFMDNVIEAVSLTFLLLVAYLSYRGSAALMGSVIAFVFLYQILSASFVRISRAFVAYRTLRVHLDRLADVVHADLESSDGAFATSVEQKPGGSVTLESVHFSYSPLEPEVIRGINLRINEGEFVAMTGDSGSGKSTLLKLMLRLEKPTQGVIRLGESDIRGIGKDEFSQYVAAVMQDDVLMSGTIQDNITLFDPQPDVNRMQMAARAACIHDDIASLPLKYATIVSDASPQVSGGQRQRIILARALYKLPLILVLDEPTSNIDVETERQISRNLAEMKITRIMVAHRPDAIAEADRVITVKDGRIMSDVPSNKSSRRVIA